MRVKTIVALVLMLLLVSVGDVGCTSEEYHAAVSAPDTASCYRINKDFGVWACRVSEDTICYMASSRFGVGIDCVKERE